MQTASGWFRVVVVAVVMGGVACESPAPESKGGPSSASQPAGPGIQPPPPSSMLVANRFGFSRTMTASGSPLSDPANPFFQSLGQNGRSCNSCHVPEAGMTITPEFVRERFEQTEGLD